MKKLMLLYWFTYFALPQGYAQDMKCVDNICYYANTMMFDDHGTLYQGIIVQDYAFHPGVNPNDDEPIVLTKDTKVQFFPGPMGNGISGTLMQGVLAQPYSLPCYGISYTLGGVVFPAGTEVAFQIHDYNEQRCKRVCYALLGADTTIPGLGVCHRGDIIVFDLSIDDSGTPGNTPDEGRVFIQH